MEKILTVEDLGEERIMGRIQEGQRQLEQERREHEFYSGQG